MATIAGFKRKFENLYGNSGEKILTILSDEVRKSSDVILDLNRDQLLYGRDANGEELTPGYLSDPYFKSFEQAKSYFIAKFKLEQEHMNRMYYNKVQLFPKKDRNTPNLLITGELFFNHFYINVSNNSYTIGSNGSAASDIEAKYGKVYGLASASRDFYYKNWLRNALWTEILKHLEKR